MHDSGYAVCGGFERDGDLLLDLLRRNSSPLCNDLDVVVCDVGVRLNRQIVERNYPPDEQHKCQPEDQQAVGEGEIEDAPNHHPLPTVDSTSSLLVDMADTPPRSSLPAVMLLRVPQVPLLWEALKQP